MEEKYFYIRIVTIEHWVEHEIMDGLEAMGWEYDKSDYPCLEQAIHTFRRKGKDLTEDERVEIRALLERSEDKWKTEYKEDIVVIDKPKLGLVDVMKWIRNNPDHEIKGTQFQDYEGVRGFKVNKDECNDVILQLEENTDKWLVYAEGLKYFKGEYGFYELCVDGKYYEAMAY